MKILTFWLLIIAGIFCILSDNDKNKKCFYLKKLKFIGRGSYQDVLNKTGALISNVRTIQFSDIQTKALPTIMAIYSSPEGFTIQDLNTDFIYEFIRPFEINTIRFWVYDRNSINTDRPFDLQVYLQGPLIDSIKILVYDSTSALGLVTFQFSDSWVKRIYFFNRGGSNVNSYLHFLKIQAYYSF